MPGKWIYTGTSEGYKWAGVDTSPFSAKYAPALIVTRRSVAAACVTAIAPAKFGATIYLVNNLPYAVRLEYGWSKQAPAGMVRITAAEFQSIVDDAARSPA